MGRLDLSKMLKIYQGDYALLSAKSLQQNDRFVWIGSSSIWIDILTKESYFSFPAFHLPLTEEIYRINTAMPTNTSSVLVYSVVLLDKSCIFKFLIEEWIFRAWDLPSPMLGAAGALPGLSQYGCPSACTVLSKVLRLTSPITCQDRC